MLFEREEIEESVNLEMKCCCVDDGIIIGAVAFSVSVGLANTTHLL